MSKNNYDNLEYLKKRCKELVEHVIHYHNSCRSLGELLLNIRKILSHCPICSAQTNEEHYDDCKFGKAIKQYRENKGI